MMVVVYQVSSRFIYEESNNRKHGKASEVLAIRKKHNMFRMLIKESQVDLAS